jgi:hypothetical protein
MVAPTPSFGHPTVLISATVAVVNTVLRLASGFVSPTAIAGPKDVSYPLNSESVIVVSDGFVCRHSPVYL